MEVQNLKRNLKEVFNHKYIVPLYQRNYTWAEDEITLLLQDLYENFKKNKSLNYFIGSLTVLKREDGTYEVIDGQQRLTTLSLLLKIIGSEGPNLTYESRKEVEDFFNSYYKNGKTADIAFNHKVSHLINAVELLNHTIINPDEHEKKTLPDISKSESFKKFILENVILIHVEIPDDTDVASYFEIMNNRGEQLQKHEILKSHLMETLKDKDGNYFEKQQDEFSKIWDACSQMDYHIQELFSKEDKEKYFGKNYDQFNSANFEDEEIGKTTAFSIDVILNKSIKIESDNNDKNNNSGKHSSIIDFSNFLMHVLKLKYGTYLHNGNETDIPLNEKELLTVHDSLQSKIDAKDFINDLLYYRTVFDRFIVKSLEEDNMEDNYRWALQKPYKNPEGSLAYRNTFESDYHDRLIKSISLLQVSFRNRKYKNWLQEILKFFSNKGKLELSDNEYQIIIDLFMMDYFKKNIDQSNYDEGVRVPHFLFNFIDYLYWVQSPKDFKFKFTYRNSVEHHLPQSYKSEMKEGLFDNLGNLCLVSKSSNSKMNNEHPKGKSAQNGKYYKNGKIPPKQKRIYDLTNDAGRWGNEEILKHRLEVEILLDESVTILKI